MSTDALIIRKARPEDAEEIVAYLNAVGGESDNLLFGENEFRLNAEQERAYIEDINQKKTSVMLVGALEDQIVSVGIVSAPARPRIAHTADLSISVRKACWNLGIGRRMLAELMRFARENDVTRLVQLSVRTDNLGAVKLYREAGFEEVGIVRGSTRIGSQYFDTMSMCCYISGREE